LLTNLSAGEFGHLHSDIDVTDSRFGDLKAIALGGGALAGGGEAGLETTDDAPLFIKIIKLSGERGDSLSGISLSAEREGEKWIDTVSRDVKLRRNSSPYPDEIGNTIAVNINEGCLAKGD
jgi:hypothetical protein